MVFTLLSNGRLMKPQTIIDGVMQDYTSSTSTIGSSNKKKFNQPGPIERYDSEWASKDWVEDIFPSRNKS
jgi:hypothetical protein